MQKLTGMSDKESKSEVSWEGVSLSPSLSLIPVSHKEMI